MEIDLNVVIEELMEDFKSLRVQNAYLKAALKATQQELSESKLQAMSVASSDTKRAVRSRKDTDTSSEGVGEGVE